MAPTMHPRLLGWPQQAPHPGALRRRAQHDHSSAFEAARVEDRQTALPEVGQKVLPRTVGRFLGRLGDAGWWCPSSSWAGCWLWHCLWHTKKNNFSGAPGKGPDHFRYLRSPRAALHSNGLDNWKHLEVERRSSEEKPGGESLGCSDPLLLKFIYSS